MRARAALMALGIALLAVAASADYLEVDRKTAVRKQPSGSADRAATVEKSDVLPLLDEGAQQNGYYHVVLSNGGRGWVYRTFVRRLAGDVPGTALSPAPPASGGAPVAFTGAFQPGCELPYQEFAQDGLGVDETCSVGGTGSAGSQAQNRMKNNLCSRGLPVPIMFADLGALQAATEFPIGSNLPSDRSKLRNVALVGERKVGEGTLVRLAAFVMKAHHSNVSKGETVNCKLTGKDSNDVHIVLMPEAPAPGKELDECGSITAEMIPHYRPWFWDPQYLLGLDRPLRFTGSLLYDAAHRPCKDGKGSPKRAASWEIHPVYAVEVCGSKTLAQCPTGDDSKWVPLEEWHNLEEDHEEDHEG